MIQAEVVESALANLRPGLESDGFDLRVGAISSDSTVQVILEARPDACLDCLVPDEFMVSMIEDLIRKQESTLRRVELVKLGFDAVAPH